MVSRKSPRPTNPSKNLSRKPIYRNMPEETSPGSSQNLNNATDGMHVTTHKTDKNKFKNAKPTKK